MAGAGDDLNFKATMDVSGVVSGVKSMTSAMDVMNRQANSSSKGFGNALKDIDGILKNTVISTNKLSDSVDGLGKRTRSVSHSDLPSLRYALYDVANSAGRIYGAFSGAIAGAVDFAAKYQTAFTDVERTTLSNVQLLDSIKTQLMGLSQQIPMTFGDISGIASLGAQLGVATGDLAGFSKTVAEFSAVTNVSAETAAQSFGALGELLNISASQYQNLGSAIAAVGVNSVATESEILSVATAIGGVANSAGLSADYVVGLSGALASLRVPAEQSRGALTRIFQEINRSAAGSGVAMQNFANIMGITAKEAQSLATSNMQGFFTQFVQGLSGLDSTQLTTTLDALNLADIRVTNTLTRLSRNTELLSQTLGDSSSAFSDGTFLSAVYALKVDDLASKFKILQNTLQNFAAQAGTIFEPILGPIVDVLNGFVSGLNSAMSTGAGKIFLQIAGWATVAVAAISGLIQALALGTAALYAMRFAITHLGWDSASKGIAGLVASIFGVVPAAGAATVGVNGFKLALIGTGIGAVIVLLGSLAAAFTAAAQSATVAFSNAITDTAGLSEALAKDTLAYEAAVASGNTALISSFSAVEYAGTSLGAKYGEVATKAGNVATVVGTQMPSAFNYASSSIDQNTRYIGANTDAWLRSKLVQSEVFQNLVSKGGVVDLLTSIGFNFTDALAAAAKNGQQGMNDYFMSLASAALNSGKITADQLNAVDQNLLIQLSNTNNAIANAPVTGVTAWFANIIRQLREGIPWLADWLNGIANMFGFDISGVTGDIGNIFAGGIEQASLMELAFDGVGTSGTNALDSISSSASGAAAKVYLLTDYANDLSTVWKRAFDIRFSGQAALDAVAKGWRTIKENVASAREEIDGINADLQTLSADKALKQYWLSIAEAAGDAVRAAQLRAEIAKIDSDIAKKNDDLTKSQNKANRTLVGNSDAAIENRTAVRGMVTSTQEYIKALAASGLKGKALSDAVKQAKEDFYAQGAAAGYARDELTPYAAGFDDVSAAIANVPRNVTIDFNGDAALTAIKEWATKANQSLGGVGGVGGVGGIGKIPAKKAVSKPAKEKTQARGLKQKTWWDDVFSGKIRQDFLDNTAGMFNDMWKNVGKGWSDFWAGLTNNPVTQFIGRLSRAVSTDLSNFFKPLVTGFQTAISTISNTWTIATKFIGLVWDTYVTQPINSKLQAIGLWWNTSVVTPITAGMRVIGTWWNTNVVTPISAGLQKIGSWWGTYVSRPINDGITWIKNTWNGAVGAINTWWTNSVVKPIETAIGRIRTAWGNWMGAISSWVNKTFGWITNTQTWRVAAPLIKKIFGFAEGGYTGAGGKYQPAGIVHKGEYVVPKSQVNQQTGLPYYMSQPRSFAAGGFVGQQSSMVYLSPEDRALLRNVGGSGEVVLYANNEAIARSANAGNKSIVAAGGRP